MKIKLIWAQIGGLLIEFTTDVSDILICGDIMELNISICDLIAYVMVMSIDVLCVSVTEVVLRV